MSQTIETLSLVVVNIEASQHLPEVIAFLKATKPDAVLMQEVFRPDLPLLSQHLEMEGRFVPMCKKQYSPQADWQDWGLAILARPPILDFERTYIGGVSEGIPKFNTAAMDDVRKAVARVRVDHTGGRFDLLNTHFTWTPDGQTTPLQLQDLTRLQGVLGRYEEFVLGGDFNAPRGGYIWNELARLYRDNIPSEVTTTIDGDNHRAGPLQLVVDGLFTTQRYRADRVEVVNGISDHCAITAEIRKVA